MGFSTQHAAIRARFAAAWNATAAPVAWPNVAFTPPVALHYVRFYIVDAESNQRTIGDPDGRNQYRSYGLIVAQIYALDGTGDNAALALADTAAAIFRNARFSGVWALTPKIITVGAVDAGRYQINVTIPFQRDEVL